MPSSGESLERELRFAAQRQGMPIRDASVAGKLPDRGCVLFDGEKATLEHKAAGEQGFSTARKSKSLNTVAFHQSVCLAANKILPDGF